MLKNYFKTASRALLKHRTFSIINILGLSLGITCCLVIWTYVSSELSYEEHFENRKRIFRVIAEAGQGNQIATIAVTSNKVAPLLKRDFPEVEEAARFANIGGFRPTIVKYGDKVFQERKVVAADSTFLNIFPLEFIEGNQTTPLSNPRDVIISKEFAQKYFGSESPIGKVLDLNNAYKGTITAVFKDLPSSSHLDFQAMISYHSYPSFIKETWFPMNYWTYVSLNDAEQAQTLSYKLTDRVKSELNEQYANNGFTIDFRMQPLEDIYFTQDIRGDLGARTSRQNIYAIAFIGLFVLLIACINYVNLTTAKSEKRAKEVGIRKVLGAGKKELVAQFYGETFLITLTSLIIAVLFAELALPYFNDLSGQSLVLEFGGSMISLLFLATLIISGVSGLYPSLYLSSFAPIKVLKSTFRGGRSNQIFRKLLVVVQFTITSFLILGTLVIYQQLNFANKKELGFSQKETIIIPVSDRKARAKVGILKETLLQNADVLDASLASEPLGRVMAGYTGHGEGMDPNTTIGCFGLKTDAGFMNTLDIELVTGDNFPHNAEKDSVYRYILNERLVRELGWSNEEAINKNFRAYTGMDGKVIGVVKDFHFNSLREKIEPLAIWAKDDEGKYLYLKINTTNHQQVLSYVEDQWKSINPDSPFEFSFLDAQIQELYINEQRTAKILLAMTMLSIIVGGLGLFGLTAFIVERRTKEIGIKKVLGASVKHVMLSLSNEFMVLVIISFVLAFPAAYYFMNSWLENFVYSIELGVLPFALAASLACLLAFITVSVQTFKAAIANPVDALKEE